MMHRYRGRAVEGRVVNHHRHPVTRQPDVELDGIGADVDRAPERCHRVLRLLDRCAPVRNDEAGGKVDERVQKPAAAP